MRKPENNDTDLAAFEVMKELSEIEIEGDQDALFLLCQIDDLKVIQMRETQVCEGYGIETKVLNQKRCCSGRNVCIQQQTSHRGVASE